MIKVYEFATQLNLSSQEIQKRLKALGIDISSHMSPVTDEAIRKLKASLEEEVRPKIKPKPKTKPKAKPVAKKQKTTEDISVKLPKKAEILPILEKKIEEKPAEEKSKGKIEEEVKKIKSFQSVKATNQWSVAKPAGVSKHIIFRQAYPTRRPAIVKRQVISPPSKQEEVSLFKKTIEGPPKFLSVEFPITIKELSAKMQVKPNDILRMLLLENRIAASINQNITEDITRMIGRLFNFEIQRSLTTEQQIIKEHDEKEDVSKLKPRAPVVTIMGHVDHGKTSLLDAIRKAKVVTSEAGGITQHIGAYHVQVKDRHVTFLDTPGHEAFTAMRARGANATDVVVLVVAADDGIMPQTIEAINHAKAADVPIMVAINKMDLPTANMDAVKKQLSEIGLTPEDWSGKTITVPVSAKTGKGLEELLEMILLEADMLELKANPDKLARGVIIESRLSKNSGPLVTFLVQNGTLKASDIVVCGAYWGKIRAIKDDRGKRILSAGPSYAIEVTGLSGLPQPGESFYCVEDEKKAKQVSDSRLQILREKEMIGTHRSTLEDLSQQIQLGQIKELKIILKADVQGSLEALIYSLDKIQAKNVKLKIIHTGVGNITESDITLAIAANSIVIGFNVGKEPGAEQIAKKENVDVKLYRIIYELTGDIKSAMAGLLEAKTKEVFTGEAIVQQVFKFSKGEVIAGCRVTRGKAQRGLIARVFRGKEKVFEGRIDSLKRFKEDVKEVTEGFECGIGLKWNDIQADDKIACYTTEKVEQKME